MCTFITARHNATQYYYVTTSILPTTTTPFFLLIIGLLTHGIYQIISNQKTQGLLRRHEGIANNQGQ